MDCVLVKVKRLRKESIFKLLSDSKIFKKIDVDAAALVDYAPDHNLDEDSWFRVGDFGDKNYFPKFLGDGFDVKNFNDLTKNRFPDISYILSVQDGAYYFQKVTPSLFLKRKTVVFGDVAEVQNDVLRLVINSEPDAVYDPGENVLLFKSLATVASMFQGIDQLYKEATQEEVKDFLEQPFVEVSGDFGVDKVSKPNRRRIALAMATLAGLPDNEKKEMLSYIDDYCGDKLAFDKNNGKFEISTDFELKMLVYGIEQRFYTTQFGKEKRLANSVQALV